MWKDFVRYSKYEGPVSFILVEESGFWKTYSVKIGLALTSTDIPSTEPIDLAKPHAVSIVRRRLEQIIASLPQ